MVAYCTADNQKLLGAAVQPVQTWKTDYKRIIALDFSKAFDTVRHNTFIRKMASFPIPDNIYNWLVDHLDQREHCTRYGNEISTMLRINASIVQGSGIGPSAFVCNASDLHPVNKVNRLTKYADDTYLIVPAKNSATIPGELVSIRRWAIENNLKQYAD